MRMVRNWPMVMLAETPIIFCLICSASRALAWAKPSPATEMGPICGKDTAPSRSTVSSNSLLSLPNSCTLISSPGPSTYSGGTGTSVTGAKLVGSEANRSYPYCRNEAVSTSIGLDSRMNSSYERRISIWSATAWDFTCSSGMSAVRPLDTSCRESAASCESVLASASRRPVSSERGGKFAGATTGLELG